MSAALTLLLLGKHDTRGTATHHVNKAQDGSAAAADTTHGAPGPLVHQEAPLLFAP